MRKPTSPLTLPTPHLSHTPSSLLHPHHTQQIKSKVGDADVTLDDDGGYQKLIARMPFTQTGELTATVFRIIGADDTVKIEPDVVFSSGLLARGNFGLFKLEMKVGHAVLCRSLVGFFWRCAAAVAGIRYFFKYCSKGASQQFVVEHQLRRMTHVHALPY